MASTCAYRTRAFGVAAVCRISLLVLAFVGLGFATSPADAGANWTSQASGTTNNLHGVHFVNTANERMGGNLRRQGEDD